MKRIMLILLIASLAFASELCQKLNAEGWCFVPPRPKSAQANYGNYDKRTTWFYGFWKNDSQKECSIEIPRYISKANMYIGDGRSCESSFYTWRNGGYIPLNSLEKACLCSPQK